MINKEIVKNTLLNKTCDTCWYHAYEREKPMSCIRVKNNTCDGWKRRWSIVEEIMAREG